MANTTVDQLRKKVRLLRKQLDAANSEIEEYRRVVRQRMQELQEEHTTMRRKHEDERWAKWAGHLLYGRD